MAKMMTINSEGIAEAQIRALIDARVKAISTRDINSAMSTIAPDILSFDVVNPLHYSGSDAVRSRAQK